LILFECKNDIKGQNFGPSLSAVLVFEGYCRDLTLSNNEGNPYTYNQCMDGNLAGKKRSLAGKICLFFNIDKKGQH